jgi:hypothetical protein
MPGIIGSSHSFEIHSGPARHLRGPEARSGKSVGKSVGKVRREPTGTVGRADNRSERSDHVEDLGDATLVERMNGDACLISDATISAWRLEKLKTRSGFRLRVLGMSADVKAEPRGLSLRASGGRTQ